MALAPMLPALETEFEAIPELDFDHTADLDG